MRKSLWAGLICACTVTLVLGCGGSASENGAGAAGHTTTNGGSGSGGAPTSNGTAGSGGTSNIGGTAGSGGGTTPGSEGGSTGTAGSSGAAGAPSCGDLQIQAQAAADLTCQTDDDCIHPPHTAGDCTECGIVSNATSQQSSLAAAQAVCKQFEKQGCEVAQHSCPFSKTSCVAGACKD